MGHRAVVDEVDIEELIFRELSDGNAGADQRKRVDDAVDARAIREAGVHVRLAFIDTAANGRHNTFDDGHHGMFIHERLLGHLKSAVLFDKDPIESVDHDFRNRIIVEKLLERT